MELSNREIAVLVWLIIAMCYFICKSEVRQAAKSLFFAFIKFKILLIFALAGIWISLCIYILHKVGLWSIENTKSTVVWVFTFAFVLVFGLNRMADDRKYFSKIIRDIFSVTAVLVFIKDFHSYSLAVEAVMVPIITFISFMHAISSTKKKYKKIERVFLNVLTVIGCIYLFGSIYKIFINFSEFTSVKNQIEFIFPIILSLSFIPFMFVVGVVFSYESNFTRIDFAINDIGLRRYAKVHAILNFRMDSDLFSRWIRELFIIQTDSREGIKRSICDMKLRKKREQNPPYISERIGWSPHIAKTFLKKFGIEVREYNPYRSACWIAGSEMVKIGDGIITNNISYYIEGDEFVARHLKIILNINDMSDNLIAEEYFIQLCNALLVASFAGNKDLSIALSDVQVFDKVINCYHIKLTRENHINKKINPGYTLKFQIDHCGGSPVESNGMAF